MIKRKAWQEILEQAILEVREALWEEGGEAEDWDPDAYEEVVRQFTRELGQQMLQVWAEVRTEQVQAQAPFVPVVGEDAACTDGRTSGG